ncbi:MAG: alpha/beta fold hydrolase [Planctomycetota bacterium]
MADQDRGDDGPRPLGGRVLLAVAAVYLAILVVSWTTTAVRRGDPPLPPGRPAIESNEFGADGEPTDRDDAVRVAYRAYGNEEGPTLVLLHGSPGSSYDFRSIGPLLAERFRLVAPDLPGFGLSTRKVADYSVRAHAAYTLRLMDELGVERAHLLGFSMGGGVALEIADAAPERVRSITMLAALGVEELELLGEHTLNHGIHGLQLGLLRLSRVLIPHFGELDDAMLSIEYARNFYDTDQRRLRPIMESFEPPMLILHGETDFLIPAAAAREHARIVPQAELLVIEDRGHFIPWTVPSEIASEVASFVDRVESGEARTRATAEPERVARASEPFDAKTVPPFEGPAFLAVLLLLALATLVSEDLACIAAGLLVADGRLGLVPASAACFAGIFVGDMLLYLVGRLIGRAALRHPPLKWVVSESAVNRASHWFERKGIAVIFLSRFTPGLRLPTYVAAGILRTKFRTFAFFFAIAGILWTPALVAIAAFAGEQLAEAIGGLGAKQLPWVIALIVVLWQVYGIVPLLFTHKGRRLLRGRWLRLRRWEFWPPWITYVPVLAYVQWLGIRHRGLSIVTAANPAMPAGGFVGESKFEILRDLGVDAPEIPQFELLRNEASPAQRERLAREFLRRPGVDLPVVLKPDAGQRGSGVAMIDDEETLVARARALDHDAILQQRVDGDEFGIFYTRHPDDEQGSVFGVTTKVLPTVTGDGTRTVEDLLLDDPRACAMHAVYLQELGERSDEVPAEGEVVALCSVGTHARGAIFLDGEHLITPELEAAVERIARRYEGFFFGRFDIRVPSAEALSRGEGVSIIELNGVTSEATHVYDPRHSIFAAYRILFAQWRIAYAIGAANAARGAETTGLLGILSEWRRYRRRQRSHRT